MTGEPRAVGVVPAGDRWLAAAVDRSALVEAVVSAEVGALWGRYGEVVERIVVGVPVGLHEEGDPTRECDERLRDVLGSRAGVVPTPPVREATRRRRYPAARRVHDRLTGADLSEAAFAMAPAIAAVDELLQEVPDARALVRASHPELAYRAFAGEPTAHSRATAGGYAERMRALVAHDRDAPPTVQDAAEAVAGADVAIEDVLDAVALATVARPVGGELYALPSDPPTDSAGLPMAWHYRAAEPLDA